MKTRTVERVLRIRIPALVLALAFLACMDAMGSEVERQIPAFRDTAGSGLTTEISLEGTRRTATPFLTLYNPTVRRIEERIVRSVKRAARSAAKEIPPGAIAAGSPSRTGLTGTQREDSGCPGTFLASLPPVPVEITARSVGGFLKGLHASRKGKPAPSVVVAVPELRLGTADGPPR